MKAAICRKPDKVPTKVTVSGVEDAHRLTDLSHGRDVIPILQPHMLFKVVFFVCRHRSYSSLER